MVWLAADDGAEVGRALGGLLAHQAEAGVRDLPELEVLPASYDLPGARLLDLVEVMDQLRARCPWVQQQTHRSLVRYLVEESAETVEAIETGDRSHLREELGDLLFQVIFHARLAEESPEAPWAIDDVAGDLVEKLIRRNPHVFAAGDAADAAEVESVWDALKAEEKRRTSAVEGVPLGLPALSLADKLLSRTSGSGTGSAGRGIGTAAAAAPRRRSSATHCSPWSTEPAPLASTRSRPCAMPAGAMSLPSARQSPAIPSLQADAGRRPRVRSDT